MIKVALRVYNREIETLIDQGHTEEAVAHCMHILKIFPKHLETYRLMGKAYLEAHRYTDASDIFLRVLLAVPDDFVSQLGMSIVCDEKRDLSGAIWHMERAFEINSTNGGIQGELRRLYGRRDGVEPARIHLTRGALAQIYMKAGEFQQAITEIKSVLAEDETRIDMKTLLARAYFRAGLKNEAVELCIELLKLYPYSLDGNRIMVEILPGTSMAQGVDQYQRRIRSLDPYAAASTGSVFNTQAVPDDAVTIDRLNWDDSPQPQDAGSASNPAYNPEPAAEPAEEIPTWMAQSGWGPSNGEALPEELAQLDEPEETAPASGEIASAEIPDWLKAMAPPAAILGTTPQSPGKTSEVEDGADFDWLSSLGAPASKPAVPDTKDTSTEPPAAQAAANAAAVAGTTPAEDSNLDWLTGLGSAPVGAAAADESLDWLNSPASGQKDDKPAAAQPAPGLPDWLSDLNKPEASTPAPAENAPDWLQDLAIETPAATPGALENNPDWLKDMGANPPLAPIAAAETPAAIPAETDDTPDWLKSLAAVSPAAETPAATPAETEDTPDWLKSLAAVSPAAETPAAIPAETEDTPDWLKSLAAVSPAAETPAAIPAETEDTPDWLKGLAAVSPAAETPAATPDETEDTPDWLKSLAAVSPAAETPAATPEAENDSDWFQGLAAASPAAEIPAATPTETEDTPDWLKSLAAVSPAAETPAATPEAENDSDWLQGLAAASPAAEIPAATPAETEDTPDWLKSLAAVSPAAETPAATPEAESESDWLDEFLATPTEPLKSTPVDDWMDSTEQTSYNLDDIPGQASSQNWWEGLSDAPSAQAEEPFDNSLDRLENTPDFSALLEAAPDQPTSLPAAAAQPEEQPLDQIDDINWLDNLMSGQNAEPDLPVSAVNQAPAAAETPSEEEPLSALVTGPGTSAAEQDDALAWLESLAQKQGAKQEELITPPADRNETAPTWVSEQPAAEVPALEETPAAEELSALVTGPGTSAAEQDDALAWLESLAQKQGAKQEELITPPADRNETAPTWVSEQPAVEAPATAETPAAEELSALVTGPGTSAAEQDDALAWLESLAQKQGAKQEELITPPADRNETAPTWVSEQPAAEAPAVAETPAGEEPLSALVTGPGTSAAEQDDALAWLESLAQKQGAKQEELITPPADRNETAPTWVSEQPAAEVPALEETPAAEELSALVTGPGTSAAEQDDALAWLESLAQKQGAKQEELITPPADRNETAPTWVSEQPAAEKTPAVAATPAGEELSALVTGPGTSAAEQDDALAWLESLAQKQGAKQEELITPPADRNETAPTWVSEQPAANQAPAAAATPAAEEPLSALVTGPGTSAAEQDDALAWLESLAQKQGAKQEELITPPADRNETAPTWVSEQPAVEAPATAETPAAEELSALVTGPGTSAAEQDDALAWLESLAQKQGAKQEELITPPADRSETAPTWVSEQPAAKVPAQEETPAAEELSALVTGPGTSAAEQDDALAWLESLAQKQGAKQEELITPPADRNETAPTWVSEQPAAETPAVAATPAGEEPLSALVTGPGTSAAEQDDALAWLESLAQKQGAKQEELITPPADRNETAPTWVSEQPAAPAPEPLEFAAEAPDALTDTTPTRLSQAADTQPTPLQPAQEEIPVWLQDLTFEEDQKPQENIPQPDLKEPGTASTGSAETPVSDENFDWLGDLSKPEEPASSQPLEQGKASGINAQTTNTNLPDVPDVSLEWLTGLAAKPAAVQTAGTTGNLEEASDWFTSLDKPDGSKTTLPMPWEQEAPGAEIASEPVPAPAEPQMAEPHASAVQPVEASPLEAAEPAPAAASSTPDQTSTWLASFDDEEPKNVTSLPWEPAALEPAEPATASSVPNETNAWLNSLEDDEPKNVTPLPWEPAALEPAEPASTTARAEAQPAPVSSDQTDDDSAWLASLDDEEPGSVEPLPWEPASAAANLTTDKAQADETKPAEQMPWEVEDGAENTAAQPGPISDISDWLKNLDEKDLGTEPIVPEPAQTAVWMTQQPPAAEPADSIFEELPDWLKDPAVDHATPAALPTKIQEPAHKPPVETAKPLAAARAVPTKPVPAAKPVATAPKPVAAAKVDRPTPPRPTPLGTDKDALAVQKARELLAHGGLDGAMSEYSRLIKRGKLLEEVIFDLQEAVYSHPVDVIIWQTLGDAYFRANRLQEALDAYGKAEGLLR